MTYLGLADGLAVYEYSSWSVGSFATLQPIKQAAKYMSLPIIEFQVWGVNHHHIVLNHVSDHLRLKWPWKLCQSLRS